MSPATRPLMRFRVYPEEGSLYFVVHVWRTLREVRYVARQRCISRWRRTDAFMHSRVVYRLKGNFYHAAPKCGEIHFSVSQFAIGVVSHECNHAAIAWAQRMGFLSKVVQRSDGPSARSQMESDSEERLCYAQERMLQTIADRLRSAGLINHW